MSDSSQIDGQYYQAVPSGSWAERVMVAARDRIYADFTRLMMPNARHRLIDVGVSDVITPGANLLERLYPYPERITAVGLGDGLGFQHAYPRVTYRQIEPHVPLPYEPGAFDIGCSNAVVEHLGSEAYQRRFIADLARIARQVFIIVPNRYFPVEHHTALPLVAWSSLAFRAACRATRKDEWIDPANLILMTRRKLEALSPAGAKVQVGYTGLKIGPFSSNLYMAISPA